MIECDLCGHVYDGTRQRWLCPNCGLKSSCCEGAPAPTCKVTTRGDTNG